MIGNILIFILLLAFVALFAWLVRRAWKARRWYVKWPGVVLSGLFVLLFALITFVYGRGLWDLYAPYPVAPVSITVQGTPDQVARGGHLASVLCASCHSEDGTLPLSGGSDMSKDTGLPVGTLYPPNITPAGQIKNLSDADIYRVLRTGIDPGGRLTMMSAFGPHNMSDDDTLAIIAYLRSAPAAQKETPPITLSPLIPLLFGVGVINLNVPQTIAPVSAPPKAATSEYGKYIVSFMDCRGCHGPTLSADGGPLSPPAASNLTVIVPKWTREAFFTTMRTGVDPTGHPVEPPMPWKTIGKLDDVELEALYVYLHGLPPLLKK